MKTTPSATNHLARFEPGVHYHVYNRTNNREPLFLSDQNRRFFLSRYKLYLADYVDTFAWCLMENHFHFSLRIKSAEAIREAVRCSPETERTAAQRQFLAAPEGDRDFHTVVERQFSRMFTAYAMAFNQQHERSGNLFYRPFKRVAVSDEDHLVWLVYYLHSNPAKHGVLKNFRNYRWSSYSAFVSDKPTLLCKQEVLDWYGGLERFLEFHQAVQDLPEKAELLKIER